MTWFDVRDDSHIYSSTTIIKDTRVRFLFYKGTKGISIESPMGTRIYEFHFLKDIIELPEELLFQKSLVNLFISHLLDFVKILQEHKYDNI